MKNSIMKVIIVLVLGVLSPLFASSVSLLNPNVAPSPLDRVEDNGEGVISFSLVETSDMVVPSKDIFNTANINISIELNKLKLKGSNINHITGKLLTYFTATYDEPNNRILLTQTEDFPSFGYAEIKIPVEVTENSLITGTSFNGFNANISANDADTSTSGNASEFTYTKLRVANPPEITSMEGNSNDAVTTKNTRPSISGTCEAGLTVTVKIENIDISPTAVCQANGTFTMTPDQALVAGMYEITAVQKGDNTETSLSSPIDLLTIDNIPPIAPQIVITEDTDNDGSISEISELNGLVDILITVENDTKIGDILHIVNPDGTSAEVTVTQDILDNGYTKQYAVPAIDMTVRVKTEDAAHNISTESSDTAVMLMDIPALIPEIISIDNNRDDTEKTGNVKPIISGLCQPDYIVTMQIDGVNINPTTVCQTNGTFSLIPNVALTDGSHPLTATQVGANGVISEKSPIDTVIVDLTAPTAPHVEIIEDKDDDGTISIKDELKGSVNVLVRVLHDVLVGDILRVTLSGEAEQEMIITEDIITNGYPLTYVGVEGEERTVTAYVIDEVGNEGAVGSDKAIVVNDKIPDYIPTLNVVGTIITGAEGTLDVVIRVAEFKNATNFKSEVKVTIVKNANLVLKFEAKETFRQGHEVQNPLWEFKEIEGLYIFTYKGHNGIFPAREFSKIGLSATFISPKSSKGQFPLDVTIVGSSGETELKNNQDSEIIEYNNIQ